MFMLLYTGFLLPFLEEVLAPLYSSFGLTIKLKKNYISMLFAVSGFLLLNLLTSFTKVSDSTIEEEEDGCCEVLDEENLSLEAF